MSSWEWQAQDWLAWARTPGHDSYWHYRELFFAAIVPAPGRRTLDVGCGEGRVARDLARLGHTVVGLDASPTLVARAADADPVSRYLLADAAALPFVIPGSYLGRHRFEDRFARAGLLIERLREPPAPAAALAARPGYQRWQRLPSFLHLRAIKPA